MDQIPPITKLCPMTSRINPKFVYAAFGQGKYLRSLPICVAEGSEIRILDLLPGKGDDIIQCEIRKALLSSDLQYEALSYVWGGIPNERCVEVAGEIVMVTDNLYNLLRRLRYTDRKRSLWIDQLCINQWDVKEKTQQVNLMREIYRCCSQCLIWFGEIPVSESQVFSESDAKNAFDLVHWAATTSANRHDLPVWFASAKILESTHHAFKSMILGGNPWWHRIWTVQEAVLPPRAVIHWGPLSIEWEDFCTAALRICREPLIATQLETFRDLMDDFTTPIRGLEIAKSMADSPLDMLQRWRYRDATDIRDKVFALMGLFPKVPFPTVQFSNYELSTPTLYTSITLDLLFLENGLRPLIGRRGRNWEESWGLQREGCRRTPDLPSWALDLGYNPESRGRAWKWWNQSHRYKEFQADRKMPFEPKALENNTILSLTGLFVDRIMDRRRIGFALLEDEWEHYGDVELIERISKWELTLNEHISKCNSLQYLSGESWQDAFYRTMLGDLVMGEFPVRRVNTGDLRLFDDFRKKLSRNEIYLSLQDMSIDQSFFITEKGYIGFGPPTLKVYDEVWILGGGQVPFLLRPEDGSNRSHNVQRRDKWGEAIATRFILIGDVYVHGIMNGEALETCKGTVETVLLR